MAEYVGKVYKTESGEWAWMITENGEDIVRGAGYRTEDEARSDMESELPKWVRKNHLN